MLVQQQTSRVTLLDWLILSIKTICTEDQVSLPSNEDLCKEKWKTELLMNVYLLLDGNAGSKEQKGK